MCSFVRVVCSFVCLCSCVNLCLFTVVVWLVARVLVCLCVFACLLALCCGVLVCLRV